MSAQTYTVQAGDTLSKIAEKFYGDANQWRQIYDANRNVIGGSPEQIQVGMVLTIPGQGQNDGGGDGATGKGNFQSMLEALGAFESGFPSGDPRQYTSENTLGFMGKYQFGEPLLIDLGYYKADVYYGNGADKNYWQGSWTGKRDINSKEQFLNSRDVQEAAIREAFNLNLQRINGALAAQGQSLDNYLGQQKTFNDAGASKTITISLSGILAGAHLRGAYGVADLLLKNQSSNDEYGTSILKYVEEYGGYDVSPVDFS
jgi:LysM domain